MESLTKFQVEFEAFHWSVVASKFLFTKHNHFQVAARCSQVNLILLLKIATGRNELNESLNQWHIERRNVFLEIQIILLFSLLIINDEKPISFQESTCRVYQKTSFSKWI